MEDLINEEEFSPKKSNYNPWKSFGVFYAIAFSVVMIYSVFLKYRSNEPNYFELALITFFTPITITLIMIFHKRNNVFLPIKTIVLAVVLSMAVYFCSLLCMVIINKRDQLLREEFIIVFYIFFGLFLIGSIVTLGILLPIKRYKQKRQVSLR